MGEKEDRERAEREMRELLKSQEAKRIADEERERERQRVQRATDEARRASQEQQRRNE